MDNKNCNNCKNKDTERCLVYYAIKGNDIVRAYIDYGIFYCAWWNYYSDEEKKRDKEKLIKEKSDKLLSDKAKKKKIQEDKRKLKKHKNRIIEHVPSFVSEREPQTFYFNTTKELLEIPFVKECINISDEKFSFKFFGMSRNHLMVVYNNNNKDEWWVLGTIENPELISKKIPRISYKNDKVIMQEESCH